MTGAYQDTVQFDQNLLGALPEIEVIVENNGFSINIISDAESNLELINKSKFVINDFFRKNIPKVVIDQLLYANPYVNNPDLKISTSIEKFEVEKQVAKYKNHSEIL